MTNMVAIPELPNDLHYVDDRIPGITRLKLRGKFCYFEPSGERIRDTNEIARINALAIPPAYVDVWICPDPKGHLQATGRDARGRKQYRYHPRWREVRDTDKYANLLLFGKALPKLRQTVEQHLLLPEHGREKVMATVITLLDNTLIRIGNVRYAKENRSYGLTTLRNRHVEVQGSAIRFHFRGKSGVLQEVELDDPRVARVVRRCQQLPGQELFQYEDEDGSLRTVGSGDVNDYLREITHGAADSEGDHFTAKDFRTWHGTTQALELTRLACTQPVAPTAADKNVRFNAKAILAEVARQLGNTPAVCKKSYVHPAVLELGTRLASDAGPGLQAVWNHIGGTTSPRGLSAAERRLLAFLRKPQKLHKARPTTKA